MVANFNAPSNVELIDLTATDYEPGHSFVIYVDTVSSGTNVKVDTNGGQTIVIPFAVADKRLGDGTGIICTKVYKTGTTADVLYALF